MFLCDVRHLRLNLTKLHFNSQRQQAFRLTASDNDAVMDGDSDCVGAGDDNEIGYVCIYICERTTQIVSAPMGSRYISHKPADSGVSRAHNGNRECRISAFIYLVLQRSDIEFLCTGTRMVSTGAIYITYALVTMTCAIMQHFRR